MNNYDFDKSRGGYEEFQQSYVQSTIFRDTMGKIIVLLCQEIVEAKQYTKSRKCQTSCT